MGSAEIIKFLEKQKCPIRAMDIADGLGTNKWRVCTIIKRLLKHHEVKFVVIDRHIAFVRFRCHHAMKLYYVDETCL